MEEKDLINEYADVLLTESKDVKCFIRFDAMYKEDLIKELKGINEGNVLIDGAPYFYKNFFSDLITFEERHGYHYKEKEDGKIYRTRFASKIVILLPKKIKNNFEKKKKFIIHFIKSLNETTMIGKEKRKIRQSMDVKEKLDTSFKTKVMDDYFNYIAYEKVKGEGTYVHIVISEREYLGKPEYIRRKYTAYWNPTTKRFCKETDPEAEVKFKKGDYILDKYGQKTVNETRFGVKIRRFSFKDFKRFIEMLQENFLECCHVVIENIQRGVRLKQKSYKDKPIRIKQNRAFYGFQFYNRKCIEEMNHVIQYIEYTTNHLIAKERKEMDQILMNTPDDRPIFDPAVIGIRKRLDTISKLFEKYKSILEIGLFIDKNGSLRVVKTRGIKLPDLTDNLDILKKQFKKEVIEINS